ncbi:MAG: ABC transporter ATP-binding protein [Proteobacteria bacterium]|nr:ABC transporter ATP-binding protein [Pseudomonadota bacterium]
MSLLHLDSVVHNYGERRTLNGVSFELQQGQIGCLMGPSGSGKTTVLLCIAGLEHIHSGNIALKQQYISSATQHVAPEKRRVGMVFQDFALFPHLSVGDNILFGLRRTAHNSWQRQLAEMLELCGLETLAEVFPHELSGGEQQRVALARALMTDPDLLLLDEPFSRLDATLHEKLSRQVRDILKARKQTVLMVTHNQNEAFLIADVGGVINEGAICQWDDMDGLYHRPRCTFVAGFVGDGALLAGRMQADGAVEGALGRLVGESVASNPLITAGDPVQVLLRPDDVVLSADATGAADTPCAPAIVEQRAFRGATTLYSLRLTASDEKIISICPSHVNYLPGDRVDVRAQVRHLILFPALET